MRAVPKRKNLPPVRRACAFLLTFALSASAAAPPSAPDLAELSLEQLSNIVVTSASRHEEKLIDAPASIYVITAEDIRRSGATSIPEALRLAPNLQVARADNNQYAISARGFNNVLADKMLVLIDGRTVYSPLFSGVFWEAQDTMMADIERIEVISGPAATLWGANGVNGVISIRTFPASRTTGGIAELVGGNRENGVEARFGAAAGDHGDYRVYAKYFDRGHLDLQTGPAIRDGSRRAATGFRTDWSRGEDQATFQGDAYWGDIDQLPAARSISGGNLLGRWRRDLGSGSDLTLQAYYDRTDRDHPGQFKEALDTGDIELQHAFIPASGHRLIWGGGYRLARDRVENTASQAFIPPSRALHWGNVFAQDEIALAPSLELTLGAKVETNVYTGSEWLPNVRFAWRPGPDDLVWGALSRAVRAPSRIDRDVFFPGAPPFLLVGNDTFASEIAKVAELGYRTQLSAGISLSATVYHQSYPNLRSIEPTSAGLVFANGIEEDSTGIEAWGSWRVTPAWRLTGGFTAISRNRRVIPGHVDLGGLAALGDDPRDTAMLRSAWDLPHGIELDVAARHSASLPGGPTPAYTVYDGRIGWRLTPRADLALIVQNLFDKDYAEWGAPANRARLRRDAFAKLTWKF